MQSWVPAISAQNSAALWLRRRERGLLYDPENGAAVAEELGCENESGLESICARPDVDAVIVATPNYLHKEPVLEAARNKKAVFCDGRCFMCYCINSNDSLNIRECDC